MNSTRIKSSKKPKYGQKILSEIDINNKDYDTMTRIRTNVRTNICTIKQTFKPGLGEGPPVGMVGAVGSMVEIVRDV